MPDSACDRGRARTSRLGALLLFAPVIAYLVVVTTSVARWGYVRFDKLDLEVLLVFAAYSGFAAFALLDARRAARVGLLAYSVLVPLLLAEGLIRLATPAPPEAVPWPPIHRITPAPDNMPGISGTIEFTTNRIGLRGPARSSLEGTRDRILCVGGSTTECLFVTDRLSWPWLLHDELDRRLGRPVYVGNAGRSGNLTIHHDYQLRNYPLAKEFQWVTVLVGINDLGTFLRDNYHERQRDVEAECLTPTLKKRLFYRSSRLGRLVYEAFVPFTARMNQAFEDPQGDYMDSMRRARRIALETHTISETPPGLERALALYRENLLHIVSATRQNRQNLVLLTQPTLFRQDLPEEMQALLWQHAGRTACTPALLARLMEEHNDVLRSVARDEKVLLVDLARMLPKDLTVFYDDCHFNISGCKKIADILADFFVERLREATPPGREGGGS